jgi:nitrogenase-stabilizing/protective protein
MSPTLSEFLNLSDAEDYFEFFNIQYDQPLVNVKRFHIMRKYGELIRTGMENLRSDETKLMDFLKFSLLRVYGEFESGYTPSAAEVWKMFEGGKLSGCLSCTPMPGNSCGC